jgi:hypothetical protein
LNDFAAALRDLNDSGVRYIIVGGLAVIRHGAVRATKDVDPAVARRIVWSTSCPPSFSRRRLTRS